MRSTAAAAALLFVSGWASSCTRLEPGEDVYAAGGSAGTQTSSGGGGRVHSSSAGAPEEAGAAAGGSPALGGAGEDNAGGEPAAGCPPASARSLENLAESGELTIASDTAWTCQHDYQLNGNVIIAPGATLAILPGTRVLMGKNVLLLSQRGAKLRAEGTQEAPIVFTSSVAEGNRAPGDYRGLILIGDAPSHSTTTPVYGTLHDSRAHFGGGQSGDPSGSCGSLRYVRVEFAGGSIDDQASPGAALTLAGCGSGTNVDYVQVHRGKDGLALLGGTVGLRHVLVTNNLLGQAIEWMGGYTGTMQFVVAQSLGASAAMQGANSSDDPEASPVSRPIIYNATLVGRTPFIEVGDHFGFRLRFGSRAVLKNSVLLGFADAAFDLDLDPSIVENQVGAGKQIDISHALLHANKASYSANAQPLMEMESMRIQDPGLPSATNPAPEAPADTPVFAPTDPTVNTQPAPVPAGFDATAGFRGAVPQDGTDWTLGWTSYPPN
jgi:hypothetical protein